MAARDQARRLPLPAPARRRRGSRPAPATATTGPHRFRDLAAGGTRSCRPLRPARRRGRRPRRARRQQLRAAEGRRSATAPPARHATSTPSTCCTWTARTCASCRCSSASSASSPARRCRRRIILALQRPCDRRRPGDLDAGLPARCRGHHRQAGRRPLPLRAARRSWLKVKCTGRQEVVIGGYTPQKGPRAGLGALLTGRAAMTASSPSSARSAPAGTVPRRNACSPPGAAAPAGLPFRRRSRRRPARCALGPARARGRGPLRRLDRRRPAPPRQLPGPARGSRRRHRRPRAAGSSRPGPAPARSPCAGVRISHADRLVIDRPAGHQGRPRALLRRRGRLASCPRSPAGRLSVIRCPDQLDEGCFYQRHRTAGMPDTIRPVMAQRGARDPEPYFAVDTLQGPDRPGPVRRRRAPPLGLPRRSAGSPRPPRLRPRSCPGPPLARG